jgi:signal transduction histidine kinase
MRSGHSLLRTPLIRYGLAVLSAAAVVLLKWPLVPHLGLEAKFLLGVVPALIASWYGGAGPGLLAGALSVGALALLFPESPRSDGPLVFVLKTMLFAGENVIVVALVATFQSSRIRVEQGLARIRSSYDLSTACARARDAHEVAEAVLRALVTMLNASGASVFLASDDERKLRLFAYRVPPWQAKLIPLYAETLLDSPAGIAFVARTRTAVFLEDEAQWRKLLPEGFAELRKHVVVRAGLCAPMVARNALVGVVVAGFDEERRFSADDRSWVQALANDFGRTLDRMRLLEKEHRACTDAEEASRVKDDFLALVSEELRLPLASIASWVGRLRLRPGDRGHCELGAGAIERCVHAQERLIDGLLMQSRTVARELGVETRRVDLVPLLRSSVEPLRIDAAAVGVDLALDLPVAAEVFGDAQRLHQVMRELASTVLAATQPGGSVRVGMEVHERRARVRIECGAAPGGPSTVGAPGGARALGGGRDVDTGLRIAKYLVEWHGGTIRFDPASPARAKTVTIELPLSDPMAGVIGMIGPSRVEGRSARSPLQGAHVFLVSDDTSEGEIIADIASREGAEVRSAPSPSEALDQLRSYSPDVIVTDLVGSERSAEGFARQLRALPSPAAKVPALAYTASEGRATVEAVLEAGYQRHLPRPPEPRALTEAIAQLCPPRSQGQPAPPR